MEIKLLNTSFSIAPFEHSPFWESIANGEWEQDSYRIILAFVDENDTVLDVGSWAGPISLFAASIAKKVYALEPDPAIFPQLKHNVKLNPKLSTKVSCHQVALFHTSGTQALFAREKYGQSSSSLLERSRDKLSNEQCQTITLLDLVAQEKIDKVNFIKLDIEGGEFDLLPTLSPALQELNYPTLYISFHYTHLKESILKRKLNRSFLSKLILKIERKTSFSFFEKEALAKINVCFNALKGYRYIYTKSGQSVDFSQLLENPQLIKTEDLVFSNQKWNAID